MDEFDSVLARTQAISLTIAADHLGEWLKDTLTVPKLARIFMRYLRAAGVSKARIHTFALSLQNANSEAE